MSLGESAGKSRRSHLALDHVLVAVPDLVAAARRFQADFGLTALEGGRHPGGGTANAIVPLGPAYLELVTVVDAAEAAGDARGRRVAESLSSGRTFAGWAVRCGDLQAMRRRLLDAGWELPPPRQGSRQRPDGSLLGWWVQDLGPTESETELPFLIAWSGAAGEHPGRMPVAHRRGGVRLSRLVVGHPEPASAGERLRHLLGGGVDLEMREAGRPGLLAIELQGDRSLTISETPDAC